MSEQHTTDELNVRIKNTEDETEGHVIRKDPAERRVMGAERRVLDAERRVLGAENAPETEAHVMRKGPAERRVL
jgi:hypothetical protein